MSDLINKGRHLARCHSLAFDQTGTDDKETAVPSFRVEDDNDPQNGWGISAFLYFTDGAVDRTLESLRHMGWTGDELAELPDIAAAGGLSQLVEIIVDHEEWDGKTRAKVKWINKVGGGAVKLKKPLEGRDLASFSARMKSRARASMSGTPTKNGTGSAKAPHPNAPGNGNDDIPFLTADMAAEPSAIARVIR